MWGLPPNTDFDLFVIQVPNKPFGLSWYQGDIETNKDGVGYGEFIGRFSIETFIWRQAWLLLRAIRFTIPTVFQTPFKSGDEPGSNLSFGLVVQQSAGCRESRRPGHGHSF